MIRYTWFLYLCFATSCLYLHKTSTNIPVFKDGVIVLSLGRDTVIFLDNCMETTVSIKFFIENNSPQIIYIDVFGNRCVPELLHKGKPIGVSEKSFFTLHLQPTLFNKQTIDWASIILRDTNQNVIYRQKISIKISKPPNCK
jgi:predicted choloylglycine hydrolase